MERVLVTREEDNRPSAKIIERRGGVLEDVGTDDADGVRKCRYWID